MTVKTYTAIYAIVTTAIAALALLLVTLGPSRAEFAPSYRSWERNLFYWGSPCHECERLKRIRRQAAERAWRQHEWERRERRHAKVWRDERSFTLHSRDDDHDSRGRHCQPKIAVVGDQYASEAGAQEEANKAWMQTARWQYGERYMARDHAIEATYECGRSSVGSVVGQVFYRCRLTARPCSAQRQRGN